MADRYDELHDLADDARENDDNTDRGDNQPRLPRDNVVMLQAPRHAHQADHIEGHEGDVETDEPAPERGRPQRSSSLKPNALGNQ